MSDIVLSVTHLSKAFGTFTAVEDVSFEVKKGEIVGLLGPNGAGKTTTIQMLLGLVTPSAGSIDYFGKSFFTHRQAALSRINFTAAYSQLQGKLSIHENLRIFSGLYQVKNPKQKIDELMELLEISQFRNTLFWHLSSGQKTRVMIAKSLLNNPELILMDEPTAFLDPEIAAKVIKLILNLQKKEQVSILYTSHRMEEIEQICDRVIFVHQGKIIIEDTPLGLTKRVGDAKLILAFDGSKEKLKDHLIHQKKSYIFLKNYLVSIDVQEFEIADLLIDLKRKGIAITEIDVKKPDLEDVFLSIAKGTL